MAITASFKNSIRNSKNSADKQTRASMAAFKFPLVISISLILLSFVPRVQGNSAASLVILGRCRHAALVASVSAI